MFSYSMGRAFGMQPSPCVGGTHILISKSTEKTTARPQKTNFDRGAGVERESPSHMVWLGFD
jgi:hypothetical protein